MCLSSWTTVLAAHASTFMMCWQDCESMPTLLLLLLLLLLLAAVLESPLSFKLRQMPSSFVSTSALSCAKAWFADMNDLVPPAACGTSPS